MTDSLHFNAAFGPGVDESGMQAASSSTRRRGPPGGGVRGGENMLDRIVQMQRRNNDRPGPRSKQAAPSTTTSHSHSQIPSSSTVRPTSPPPPLPAATSSRAIERSEREQDRLVRHAERDRDRAANQKDRDADRRERDLDRMERETERAERDKERAERHMSRDVGPSVPGPSRTREEVGLKKEKIRGRYEDYDDDDDDDFDRDNVALRPPADLPAGPSRRGGRGMIYGDGRKLERPESELRRDTRGLREFHSAPQQGSPRIRQDEIIRDRFDDTGITRDLGSHPRQGTGYASRQTPSVGSAGASTSSQVRKLFDPHVHDPVRFSQAPSASGGSGTTGTFTSRTGGSSLFGTGGGMMKKGSSLATSISMDPRDRGGQGRDGTRGGGKPAPMDDEEGDRERERRRRREGSERGSLANASRRKEDDGRSKGSRSSEGSESLKDRERGRGKNDTGIMSRLREAYNLIQTLEKSLTDMHKKMSADPAAGVKGLIAAGILGQGFAHTANIAGTGGTGQSFNPAQRNGAIGVLRQAQDDEEDEYSRAPIPSRRRQPVLPEQELVDEEMEEDGWVELISRHKKLADAHHEFLTISLDPLIPASLHNLPVKYNIPARLWQNAFHLLLEKLRFTWKANLPTSTVTNGQGFSASSRVAGIDSHRDPNISAKVLDHLTDFIYDAYSFYTSLYEENALSNFKTAWIEALGDLARYKMAIAAQVMATERAAAAAQPQKASPTPAADQPDAEEEDSRPAFPSGASIGAEVADSWDLEDRETWRTTARDCLTASHPYPTSRESILPLFDLALQRKRATFDATATELFVLLHGMLFTKIELDNFDGVFDRFMERLEEDVFIGTSASSWDPKRKPIPQVEWLTMAAVNLTAVLQYGATDGLLRKAAAEEAAARRSNKQEAGNGPAPAAAEAEDADDHDGGSDEQPGTVHNSGEDNVVTVLKKLVVSNDDDEDGAPLSFRNALRLAFTVFEFCLRHPTRTVVGLTVLNPYITVFLTFLATVLKQPAALALLEKHIPWAALADFLNSIPKKIEVNANVAPKLMGGPPIPEDWCLRGMEWVGRKVYERGFWKTKSNSGGMTGGRNSGSSAQPRSGPKIQSEMDVLLADSDLTQADASEGMVDDVEGADLTDAPAAVTQRRWKRAAWAAGVIANVVPGFSFDSSHSRKLGIDIGGALDRKINRWEAERLAAVEAEQKRRRREEESRGEWLQEIASSEVEEVESDGDDENDDQELRELKARRRYLRSLLTSPHPASVKTRIVSAAKPAAKGTQSKISFLPGYTVLVFDTNVLLSSLELFGQVAECGKWTVVVPLPVVTELDGLAKAPAPLGPAASSAVAYLESHVRSHSTSLKIQTSKGNFLSDLAIRAENLYDNAPARSDLDPETARAQTLDDFILRVAVFHVTSFTDRSAVLGMNSDQAYEDKKRNAAKVLLLTFDRNLRLRARARGVDAADEKEMAKILGSGG